MPVVQDGVQEILTVDWIPSDLFNPRPLPLLENHPVKELIAFFYADVFFHDVVDVVVRIKNFYFDVEQTWFAFDPHKVSGLFVKKFSVDVNLHV